MKKPLHMCGMQGSHMPSSMPTFLHQGAPTPLSAASISSASPTCLRSLTSMLSWPLSLSRIALLANIEPLRPYRCVCVIPWDDDDRIISLDVHPSLMTGNCYCRGSEELESRLRCR